MRGDSEYASQHQHGVKETGKAGSHLTRSVKFPEVAKEVKSVNPSFRGHTLMTFTDSTQLELQRGDYDHHNPPKPGDWFAGVEGKFVRVEAPIAESNHESESRSKSAGAKETGSAKKRIRKSKAAPQS